MADSDSIVQDRGRCAGLLIGLARLGRTFDHQHDGGAEQQQQFGRMQPKRCGLADLRGQHHAGKTDQAADRQRDAERLVAAAGLADRGAGDENHEEREECDDGELAQGQ